VPASVKVQDVAAAVCAIVLTVGAVVGELLDHSFSEQLALAMGAAYGWLFSRAANGAAMNVNGGTRPTDSERSTP